jgi:hypothetical protein
METNAELCGLEEDIGNQDWGREGSTAVPEFVLCLNLFCDAVENTSNVLKLLSKELCLEVGKPKIKGTSGRGLLMLHPVVES